MPLDPLDASEYQERRTQLISQLSVNGASSAVAVLPAATLQIRNNDADYPFRQHSDFLYLTGLEQPDAVLVLLPNRAEGEYVLFCPKEDPEKTIWEGRQVGPERACAEYGADQAYPLEELAEKLTELLTDRTVLFYDLKGRLDDTVLASIDALKKKVRKGVKAPREIHGLSDQIAEMRCIKSPVEIAKIEKACEISVDAHRRAMRFAAPGRYEYQLEAELLHEFMSRGARFPAYQSIVGAGANACTLHYVENAARIKKDDLVLIDAGAEWQYYAADITRTFPASGRFTEPQKALYECVLNAQTAVIDMIKPGVLWPTLQEKAVRLLTQGLLDLGILSGEVDACIENKAYRDFYMHGIGHWLGLDVHDAGVYKKEDKGRPLEVGMVFTVEPGLYVAEDAKVAEQWRGIGIRIEDDVLVTETGCRVLTKDVPKTVAEIERLVQSSANAPSP